MRKHTRSKSGARELRRQAFRAEASALQKAEGMDRAQAAMFLQIMGASWRDFGMVYAPGGPALGPPVPNAMSWATDGIPFGVRDGVPQRKETP